MSNVRASWFNYAMTAPADREAFDLLAALLWMPNHHSIMNDDEANALATDLVNRMQITTTFLAEADELGLEVNRFEYLRDRALEARQVFIDAGGSFGRFLAGTFHEPTHPRPSGKADTSYMEDVIDRQTLFRLHVLSMLEAREAAREAKVAKDAAKAAQKAEKAAAKAAVAEQAAAT